MAYKILYKMMKRHLAIALCELRMYTLTHCRILCNTKGFHSRQVDIGSIYLKCNI